MFEPQDFLVMAKWLNEQDCPYAQAKARTVISRSYYSVFLTAWTRIRANYPLILDEHQPEMHQRVIDALTKIGKIGLADKLYDLKRKRVEADYELDTDVLPIVQKALQLADYIHIGLASL